MDKPNTLSLLSYSSHTLLLNHQISPDLVMETPSTITRRVTRSQTLSALRNSAPNPLFSSSSKEPEKSESNSRQRNMGNPKQERSALFDITNDSPIVGVAMGKTPSSGIMSRIKKSTPGSGEALLRGQVKNLLQKVEEEAEPSKISFQSGPFFHLLTSPMALLAPTPANTPQVANLSDQVKVVITSPVVAGQSRPAAPPQVEENNIFENLELDKSPSITRSLLLDFSSDCSSVVTEDDNSSVWSMQVNTSTKDDEDDDDDQVYSHIEDEAEEEDYHEEGVVDGLCERMRKMNFAGKHTRFVYDSEDEEIVETREQSPGVLRLKGFPTPKGKHVRFAGDE